jgi:DNA-binding NarL/FixJ family response regulator
MHAAKADCAVVNADISAPVDGAALIAHLLAANQRLPIICVGNCSEVPVILRLVRAGARDFLTAPVGPAALAGAVRHQIGGRKIIEHGGVPRVKSGKVSLLSPREREILDYVVRGFSTKHIAAAVGRVEKTIEFHRHNLMRKLGASNAAQLVHMAMLEHHSAPTEEAVASAGP